MRDGWRACACDKCGELDDDTGADLFDEQTQKRRDNCDLERLRRAEMLGAERTLSACNAKAAEIAADRRHTQDVVDAQKRLERGDVVLCAPLTPVPPHHFVYGASPWTRADGSTCSGRAGSFPLAGEHCRALPTIAGDQSFQNLARTLKVHTRVHSSGDATFLQSAKKVKRQKGVRCEKGMKYGGRRTRSMSQTPFYSLVSLGRPWPGAGPGTTQGAKGISEGQKVKSQSAQS